MGNLSGIGHIAINFTGFVMRDFDFPAGGVFRTRLPWQLAPDGEDVEIDVEYSASPPEPATRDYPGDPGGATIENVVGVPRPLTSGEEAALLSGKYRLWLEEWAWEDALGR